MASRTEEALQALQAVLDRAMADGMPRVTRNEDSYAPFENIGDGDGAIINLVDGEGSSPAEAIGSEVMAGGYEIIQEPLLEIVVKTKEARARDALFDAILVRAHAALKADRTLGSKVDWAAFASISRSGFWTDGLPYMKGAIVTLRLTFTSSAPF